MVRISNTVLVMRSTLHILLTIHIIIEMLREVQFRVVYKLEEAYKYRDASEHFGKVCKECMIT